MHRRNGNTRIANIRLRLRDSTVKGGMKPAMSHISVTASIAHLRKIGAAAKVADRRPRHCVRRSRHCRDPLSVGVHEKVWYYGERHRQEGPRAELEELEVRRYPCSEWRELTRLSLFQSMWRCKSITYECDRNAMSCVWCTAPTRKSFHIAMEQSDGRTHSSIPFTY